MERRSGIAIWRQIADEIRAAIASGEFTTASPLPGEIALAGRFGVNRHTVRNAIAALVQEGALRAERGRGTFVESRRRLDFPIGRRTRFSEGLQDQTSERRGQLLSSETIPSDRTTSEALALPPESPVIRLDMLYIADRAPISIATNFFDAGRFSEIAPAVARTGSITEALRVCGVSDYTRKWTRISARHGTADELAMLRLSPGAVVLHLEALNVDDRGEPVQYATTRLAADRVTLSVENR